MVSFLDRLACWLVGHRWRVVDVGEKEFDDSGFRVFADYSAECDVCGCVKETTGCLIVDPLTQRVHVFEGDREYMENELIEEGST